MPGTLNEKHSASLDEKRFLEIERHGSLGMKNLFSSSLDPAVPGASLPGYHALSTAPHLWCRPDSPYAMSETALVTAELSARLWRRFNGPIRLLTDPAGYEYVSGTPLRDAYDEILPVLDRRCCGLNPAKYWAAGKIAALSKLPTPCAVLDMDMLIWKPLSLAGEKLVCACVEFIDETVYPPLSFFRTVPGYAFPPEWSEDATPLNTAFLYIDDEALKDCYTREAFRFMLAEKETPDYWSICITFAEQRILGLCAEARGIRAGLLTELDPKRESFTHIWGGKSKLENDEAFRALYLERCREILRQLRDP